MRWSDVDLGRATLAVTRTRTLMGNRIVVEKDAKSLAGERQLPLPDLVGERYQDNGYVLVDGLGKSLNGRQPRERAYTVMAENALRRVRLYDAHASCFTFLANKGVPDHLLARWAGHTDVRTTKRWYVKPDVEDLRPAADLWGSPASDSAPVHEENVRCGSVSG